MSRYDNYEEPPSRLAGHPRSDLPRGYLIRKDCRLTGSGFETARINGLSGGRLMKATYFVGLLVAASLLFLLTRRLSQGLCRLCSLAALVALCAIVFSPRGEFFIDMSSYPKIAPLATAFLGIIVLMPYALLLEAGIFGYRGLSSWVRYIPFGVAVLAGCGLIAVLVSSLILHMR